MASAFSSSGSVPNAPRKYDVFISFRGEDTRNNFTSHLHAALNRASIEAFRDDKKLEKGYEIAPSLTQAIKDSSASVIVFSEDYASSKWCLDELDRIMKYRNDEGQFVIPIFYKVEPSDVRNQTGTYKKAFEKHEIDYPDKVKRWRTALSKAGKLSGRHCQTSTDESELIRDIVADVSTKLECICNCRGALKDAIGIDEMIEPIEELLKKFHKVGIWGMGGVGKTTMAKAVFAKLSYLFDNCYFLENVREKTERNGLEHVRNSLISKLLGQDVQNIPSNAVARRLGSKNVLVVLDDVDNFEQLEDLQDNICNFLGEGSKVIITTRDMQLLRANDYEIHEAKGLSYENSRQLFVSKAFWPDHPKDGYEELIKGFVCYTKHHPLALKVLGPLVCSLGKKVWHDLLTKLRAGNPDPKIQKVLQLSYDGLDHKQQQIFLDIACFLKGESEEFVEELLESYDFYPTSGMQTLKDKALIFITRGRVEMHDLIQEMGRQIVRQESIVEPGKRSRLWDSSEIFNVLGKREGGKKVEGIMLLDGYANGPSDLTAKSFNKMTRLRFLKIISSYWEYDISTTVLESFSTRIKYFHWKGYPMRSLPSNFCAKHLLELNLDESLVETLWEGVQDLTNLRRLKLENCFNLRKLPDFSKACRLESVNLYGCERLRYLHASLLSLHNLIYLDVSYCYSLKSVQSRFHLKSLKEINTRGSSELREFSVSSEVLTSLYFSKAQIIQLSPSIGLCSKLTTLHLMRCNELTELPDTLTQLSSLETLYLYACCHLTKLPHNMRHLAKLQVLSIRRCIAFHSLPELPPSLRKLDATNCTSLESIFPSTISSTPQSYGKKLFLFKNCVKLDLGAIKEQAKLLFEKAVHEKEDVEVYYPGKNVPEWFGNNRSQNCSDTLKLSLSSHTVVGFVFCAVPGGSIWSLDVAFSVEEDEMTEVEAAYPRISYWIGGVFLCSYPEVSKSIREKIEGKRRNHDATIYNPNLSFKVRDAIEWGIYPIYASGNSS